MAAIEILRAKEEYIKMMLHRPFRGSLAPDAKVLAFSPFHFLNSRNIDTS